MVLVQLWSVDKFNGLIETAIAEAWLDLQSYVVYNHSAIRRSFTKA